MSLAFSDVVLNSLLTLSRVIVALGNPNQAHINFRDSKLTRILQPSLSGNARMAVICCATPSELYLEETRSTLQFASRAKLVKTRAQVNEVLDERSMIRRLQKELADMKRQAAIGEGGKQTEHVKALEHKAVTAGTAAKEAEEKLKRLQASILNNGVLFGEIPEEEAISANSIKNRKRRLSEGTLLLETKTPSKDTASTVDSPKTIPRPAKQLRAASVKPLAPSTELSLLKEALQAKNAIVASMKKHVDDVKRLVQTKESEIVAAQCSNDILRSERDSNKVESSKLACSLTDLRLELEQATNESKVALEEKDAAIAKALKKLEQELNDRQILEDTIDALQTDKLSLEKEIDGVQKKYEEEQSQRHAQAEQLEQEIHRLTTLTGDQETQLAEREEKIAALEQSVQAMQDRVLSLESTTHISTRLLYQAGWERDQFSIKLTESRLRSSDLECQIVEMSSELESANDKILGEMEKSSELTSDLEKATHKVDEISAENQTLQSQLSALEQQHEDVQSQLDKEMKKNGESQRALGELEVAIAEMSEDRDRVIASWESSKKYLEEAQQKINKFELDVKDSESQLSNTRDEVAKLQAREKELAINNKDLELNLDKLGNLLKQVTDELSESNTQKENVENELGRKVKELSTTMEQIKSLEETIENMKSASDDLQKKIDDLEGQVEEAQARKAFTDSELVVNEEKLNAKDARIDDLATSLEAASSKIETMEAELEETRTIKIELEQQIILSKRNVQEMEQAMENLVKELHDKTEELGNVHKAKHCSVENEQAAQIQIAGLTKRIEEYEALEQSMLERHKSSLVSQEEALNAAISKAEQTENQCNEIECELRTTTVEHETALKHLQETMAELSNGKNRISELNNVIQSLEAAEHPAVEALSAALEERKQALERVSDLEDQLQLCQSTVDDLQNKCNHITRRMRKIKGERDDARNILVFAQEKTTKLKSLVLKMESAHHDALETAVRDKEALESQVLDLENRIIMITSSQAELSQSLDDKRLENETLISNLLTKTKDLEHTRNAEATLKTQLDVIMKKKSTAESNCYVAEQTIAELEARVNELTTLQGELQQKLEDQSAENEKLVTDLSVKTEELQKAINMEANLKSQLEEVNTEKSGTESSVHEAEQTIVELKARINELTSSETELTQQLEMKSAENAKLVGDLTTKKDMLERFQEEEKALTGKIDMLTQQVEDMSQEKREIDTKMASREDDLIKVHEMLETSNSRMNEMKQQIIDLEDELESKETILAQSLKSFETDRANYTTTICELQDQISDLAKVEEVTTEKIAGLEKNHHRASDERIQVLEAENLEMKQLLLASNQSIEEAREAANSAENMVQRKNVELQECLERLGELETRLEHVSQNPLPANSPGDGQQLVEALSEKASLERKIADLQSEHAESVSQLKHQMGEEQREIIRQADANMDTLRNELANFESLLKKTESEAYIARKQKEELEDKNKKIAESVVQLESKIATFKNENARLKRASTQESIRGNENKRLKEEITTLENEVASLKESLDDGKKLQEELEQSRSTIQEMTQRIKEQDDRVKKLEEAKLTRDQYKALKKLKEEHADYKKKLKKAEKELKALREEKRTSDPAAGLEDTELTKLRFDKEALENKLRKYASHCQHLEQERANMLHVLRTTKISDLAQNDLGKAIVNLCDKVTSLEEECDSLSKSESRASSVVDEVGQLREQNRSLHSQLDESRKKTDRLQRAETEFKEELATLRRELEKLRRDATDSRTSAESIESQKTRQVKYLERENLQLMKDLKTAKKKLQSAKAEINALRLQDSDNTTMELSALKGRLASDVALDAKEELGDKESGANATKSPPPRASKSPPPRNAPGLGQALPSCDDNTQECKQS